MRKLILAMPFVLTGCSGLSLDWLYDFNPFEALCELLGCEVEYISADIIDPKDQLSHEREGRSRNAPEGRNDGPQCDSY